MFRLNHTAAILRAAISRAGTENVVDQQMPAWDAKPPLHLHRLQQPILRSDAENRGYTGGAVSENGRRMSGVGNVFGASPARP